MMRNFIKNLADNICYVREDGLITTEGNNEKYYIKIGLSVHPDDCILKFSKYERGDYASMEISRLEYEYIREAAIDFKKSKVKEFEKAFTPKI